MNKKRVLVDVTVLALAVKTDIFRAVDQIVRLLVSDNSLEVFFTLSEEDFFQQKNVDLKTGLLKYSLDSNIVANFIDSKTDPAFANIDIYLSTYYQVPDIWKKEHRVKKIVFAYDLIPLLHPDQFEPETTKFVSDFYSHLQDDWLILATSEKTKDDVINYRPDLESRNLIALHLGVSDKFSFYPAPNDTGVQGSNENASKTKERHRQFSWEMSKNVFIGSIEKMELENTPALTIITICHNAKYIEETCQSIAEQSFQNFEWIVIDGGSDQETLAVFDRYKDDISIFVSESDDGRYDAMNKGVMLSKGKYLLFLNGGDSLKDKHVLERIFSYSTPLNLINIFKHTLNSEMVYGEVVSRETGLMPYPLWKTGPQKHDIHFFSGDSLPHQATFIQRELFQQIGMYNNKFSYAGDYEWFMRAIILHEVKTQYLPIVVSIYNFEGVSSTPRNRVEIRDLYAHYLNVQKEKTAHLTAPAPEQSHY